VPVSLETFFSVLNESVFAHIFTVSKTKPKMSGAPWGAPVSLEFFFLLVFTETVFAHVSKTKMSGATQS
jgi:hypothetical protein